MDIVSHVQGFDQQDTTHTGTYRDITSIDGNTVLVSIAVFKPPTFIGNEFMQEVAIMITLDAPRESTAGEETYHMWTIMHNSDNDSYVPVSYTLSDNYTNLLILAVSYSVNG